MSTLMMDRPCSHCGTQMRWDPDPAEQCWRCFGAEHKSHHPGSHREFDKDDQRVCYCPECDTTRESGKPEPPN